MRYLSAARAGGASRRPSHPEFRATTVEPAITCTSNTGTGKFTSGTTGEIALTFHGCSTPSVFHNTYVTEGKTDPGVLVTPPASGLFVTIICSSFANIEVRGNGIIGELTDPKCGSAAQKTATLSFTATGSSQDLKKVTATGTEFSLKSVTEGGSTVAAAEVAEGTVTYSEIATLTCV